jgi:hypothetical protein
MQATISDFTQQLVRGKRTHSNGWISFNAVCCHHRGERQDTRHRGGLHPNPDGSITYKCFNCKFRTSYRPGLDLSYKFRTLLGWMGAEDNDILRMGITAMRVKEVVVIERTTKQARDFSFTARLLPEHACSVFGNEQTVEHQTYLASRGFDCTSGFEFLHSPQRSHSMARRVIVPCYWQRQLVGYTARGLTQDIRPKYYDALDNGFVFNMDRQRHDREFVLVVEGPFDAMSIDGVATLGSEISSLQADIINSLDRDVIVVPHADRAGESMVSKAIDLGWQVSFPVWLETCKDVNEAVVRYGKLFVMRTILDSIEHSSIRIKLKMRKLSAAK